MNLDDTPAERAFREQARAWIAGNAPHEYAGRFAAAIAGEDLPFLSHELFGVLQTAYGGPALQERRRRRSHATPPTRPAHG